MAFLRFAFRNSWRYYSQSTRYLPKIPLRQLIIPASTAFYLTHDTVSRQCSLIYNDSLKPDRKGDTFEMGLYISSENELQEQIRSFRSAKITESRNRLMRCLRILWFGFNDKIVEPVCTVFRFLEISAIFLPILLLYPISWFGHKLKVNGTNITETRGSLVWCQLLRKGLELAGPSFIKLGQWAGSRTDIFSHALCHELGKLHSNVSAHSLSFTLKKLCQALEVDKVEDAFDEFNQTPIGVGSIAQVYVGELSQNYIDKYDDIQIGKDGNRWCAIKILHPNIRSQIRRDLKIMKCFADTINWIPTMEWLSLPNEVEQFSILMNIQLDLRIEALNLQRFNENFKNSIQVKFPKPFLPLSNRDVMFEEHVYGLSMEKFLSTKRELNDVELCKKVSDPFVDAFLQMLILDDFVHADLHPGNVIIRFVKTNKYGTNIISSEHDSFQITHALRKKMDNYHSQEFVDELKSILTNYTPQICFIDTGIITELNEKNRINFIALFNALARFDGYKAGELMIERSRTPETAIDKEVFAFKVEKLVDKVKQRTFTLGTVSIGDLLDQMLSMVRSHHVRMESDFVSVVVAILLLEGIGRQLDPNLDLFESSLPILREFGFKREARSLLNDASTLSMLKIWVGLEVRQLMHLSMKQIYDLVRTDQLCPNY
ncbi:hypothetical protein N7582_005600 [Saccharomyces uvarum]|uniref:ABC1 atypical kinase-like domain-containing protein n=1 Tax=Saccharomyces uvarum TaxID=230603 RepID=A0AA35J9M9_SACUV|nr:hypothetical protein N7582_005600 [Saccharomyces uvarum]CAI4052944.1 hypothetical protein SUVC_16G1720 [Saccharomyces uvarum]